jgi:hypothetical protein
VGTLASSNNKTDCQDISEILLKEALNTKTLNTLTLSKKGGYMTGMFYSVNLYYISQYDMVQM